MQFPDGYVLVYDPCDSSSLDMLAGIKADIDKNKDKKEVSFDHHNCVNFQYRRYCHEYILIVPLLGMCNCYSQYAYKIISIVNNVNQFYGHNGDTKHARSS